VLTIQLQFLAVVDVKERDFEQMDGIKEQFFQVDDKGD
jgi:hypothetical protein